MSRTAKIVKKFNNASSRGPDVLYTVELWEDDNYVGLMDTTGKSLYYAQDVAENWETGIIKSTNEHIIKETKQ